MADAPVFEDILYEKRDDRAAWIIINREKPYNAFRAETIEELIKAFQIAGYDKSISSIVLTSAGDKAFCTGGAQSAHDGQYDGRGVVGLPIDEFQSLIRDVPKPTIARVNGFAIGGGSVDDGWGAALLARHIGDKRAREMFFNEQFTAQQAMETDLVNKVALAAELDAAVKAWTDIPAERSPTALALAKRSFDTDSESICGISLAMPNAVKLFYETEKSKESVRAFKDRRRPDFHAFEK